MPGKLSTQPYFFFSAYDSEARVQFEIFNAFKQLLLIVALFTMHKSDNFCSKRGTWRS